MACSSGTFHTITLSSDGVVYSFGNNDLGQLGLGHEHSVCHPTQITTLPKIKQISCGWNFAACVDEEGFLWSFGNNNYGQLGTGNIKSFNVPQKILNIPPVLSVSCGPSHTMIITNDSDLWSCGNNEYGQLCLGYKEICEVLLQQTKFSDVSKVSVGGYYSIFQDINGNIYSCGRNDSGQLGLRHFNSPEITPTLIPNLPSNIVQFVSGYVHNLFLDSEGNVYCFGYNYYGQLGLSHKTDQNVLNQIPNIPPIQTISCVFQSSYLIDFEGNLWSFGSNSHGQLGNGETMNRNVPTRIDFLKDIQQISYGPCGYHFLAKDSQNTIFASGNNSEGQVAIDNMELLSIPTEINPKYFSIWGEVIKCKAKSARK